MTADTGPADGSAPATQPAGVFGSASALAQLESWHHDLVELVDGWAWIRTLNDQLTAVLADRKSTRLNSSHITPSRMPSSA